MLERFGVVSPVEIYQSPGLPGLDPAIPELSTERSRLRSYRYRPHFVSTAKGLRNIPAQLNDGQLVHAPDDATDRPVAPLSTAPVNLRRPAGTESPAIVGRPPSTTTSSSTIKNLFNSFKRKVKAIYPGTVWCGDGNQAKSEDDIGFFYLTDSCCRAHDLCPITIAAGEQFNRLRNNGHFTRSHCDCDKQFYNCLKNADTLVSRQVGYTYFNLLKPQCFRYEHPKVSCTKKKKGKCLSYVVDEQQSKQWQWFDNLIF
uniref:Phospholipase A2 n=1 Tax=Anopheles braziliensis TaxID=58242 RepID=A0A2M3ZI75_9DIPT